MISAITTVWNDVLTFITSTFPSIEALFVTNNSGTYTLTFVGVLAVIMAGVALILLVFNLVRSFLVARA